MTVRRYIFNVDYDSNLGYPNEYNETDFKLFLKLFLSQINPDHGHKTGHATGTMGEKVEIQAWTQEEWDTYKSDVKNDVEKYLNWPQMTLVLKPQVRPHNKMSNIQYLWFVGKQQLAFPAVVRCGLTVELVDHQSKAHAAFQVVRVKDGETTFYRAYDTQIPGGQDYGRLTNQSVDRYGNPVNWTQSGVTHELGHVLGLDHINAHDPKCKNDNDVCYGKPGTPEYANWMGHGSVVSEANAAPWRNRIRAHAYGLDWSATTQYYPELNRAWLKNW